jgi:E1A/CREB-binding protein
MQQQVDRMVQAPGFSHHQILPANPIGANGAGCLNGQWNAMPLVQEQQPMPFSMNQSNYPLQHLGTHVGSGVDSRILENFSSYGSSDAQINGAMGSSNMQLSNRAAAQKEFTNLSYYGSFPEKSLQREFNRHPLQGTLSMCAIFFFHVQYLTYAILFIHLCHYNLDRLVMAALLFGSKSCRCTCFEFCS